MSAVPKPFRHFSEKIPRKNPDFFRADSSGFSSLRDGKISMSLRAKI